MIASTSDSSERSTISSSAPEWSQMYLISSGDRRVLIATSTAPASGTAKCAISIGAELGHR